MKITDDCMLVKKWMNNQSKRSFVFSLFPDAWFILSHVWISIKRSIVRYCTYVRYFSSVLDLYTFRGHDGITPSLPYFIPWPPFFSRFDSESIPSEINARMCINTVNYQHKLVRYGTVRTVQGSKAKASAFGFLVASSSVRRRLRIIASLEN